MQGKRLKTESKGSENKPTALTSLSASAKAFVLGHSKPFMNAFPPWAGCICTALLISGSETPGQKTCPAIDYAMSLNMQART